MPTKAELEEEIALLREVLRAYGIDERRGYVGARGHVYNNFHGKAYASHHDTEEDRYWVQGFAARGW